MNVYNIDFGLVRRRAVRPSEASILGPALATDGLGEGVWKRR